MISVEYRNLRHIIKRIGDDIPMIGLSYSNTKSSEIYKNLGAVAQYIQGHVCGEICIMKLP
jgi:hypothetical protein